MIVRHFISWVRTAPAGERAEATRALARAWLISDLTADDRAAAEGALLMLLDDPSPLVRQAMSSVFAHSLDAPPAIVAALALDQASVALPVLEFSPLLRDADLVDIVAIGDGETQCAIARRVDLPAPVCAAIAEVGCAAAALEVIENPGAALAAFSLDRIVERHGHLAAIRESLLSRDDLAATTRLALAQKLSDALTQFVAARGWLGADRAARAATEALERSTVTIALDTEGEATLALVRHLREAGLLTAGLILRALLSGGFDLVEVALAELADVPRARVAALLGGRAGASLDALLARAGLPATTFIAFRAALAARDEIGFADSFGGLARLRRRMVERVLTACEHAPASASAALLTLLRRFATEAAREEARLFCDELAAEADFATRMPEPSEDTAAGLEYVAAEGEAAEWPDEVVQDDIPHHPAPTLADFDEAWDAVPPPPANESRPADESWRDTVTAGDDWDEAPADDWDYGAADDRRIAA